MQTVDKNYIDNLINVPKKKPRLSTLYGMDSIFKLIYNIPFYIPVAETCLLEHGVNFQFSLFFDRLKESENELIFLDNSHRVNEFQKQTGKKAYALGPLYPKYRKLKNIQPREDRAGTLAFPSHSSSQFDFSQGYVKYVQDLKELPAHFHPVTICLYYYDIVQGHHQIFIDAGFPVITNGYIGDPEFVDHLYEHISSFKYVTSNHAGSYAFYALEMGIPFFLYGEGINVQLLQLEELNEMNMEAFVGNEFMNKFTAQMVFDVHREITITTGLRECVAYIQDEANVLSAINTRKLVVSQWKKLLLKKSLGWIKERFKK